MNKCVWQFYRLLGLDVHLNLILEIIWRKECDRRLIKWFVFTASNGVVFRIWSHSVSPSLFPSSLAHILHLQFLIYRDIITSLALNPFLESVPLMLNHVDIKVFPWLTRHDIFGNIQPRSKMELIKGLHTTTNSWEKKGIEKKCLVKSNFSQWRKLSVVTGH